MIRELINFTESLDKDVFTWNIKPNEGLHIFLNMKIDKNFHDFESTFYSEKIDNLMSYDNDLKEKIIQYEGFGRRIGTNMNKAYHKKLFACNPFIISFKRKTYSEIKFEDIENFMNSVQKVIKLSDYEKEIAKLFIIEVNRIKENCLKTLTTKIFVDDKKKGIIEKDEKALDLLGKDNYLNFYLESYPFEGNIIKTDFAKYHNLYLNQKGFNQDIDSYKIGKINSSQQTQYVFFNDLFTKEKDKTGKEQENNLSTFSINYNDYVFEKSLGISDYLNGLNAKKPYLEHKTAMFHKGISQYIDEDMARALYNFEQLVNTNKILPNPLPIIIWRENNYLLKEGKLALEEDIYLKEFKENIKTFKDKNIRLGFTEIIKNIFENNSSFKLSNFYLFNFAGGKLRDFDFVEKFLYKIDGLEIQAIFSDSEEKGIKKTIKNIYDFERLIVQPLFDNGLITEYSIEDEKKNKHIGFVFKYFDDIKESDYKNNMFLLVSKYRKVFYDYIYKSKRDSLNSNIIQEILSIGILDNIKYDEYKNNKHSNKYKIYTKLNLWFSLCDYLQNNIKTDNSMVSKIEKFRDDFIEIIQGKRFLHDGEDELFAYVAGQVVNYIQAKSRSADKSYARLEPFLNKTGANEFKSTLKDEFAKYKHERYSNEFNNPFAQVNIYPLTQNMKDLLPFFLGGYFSKNLLFPGSINELKNNNQ